MKKPKFFLEPIDLVIIFFYYLFSVLLILSLVGLFKNYYIAISLIVFLIFLLIFRKRIQGISLRDFKKGLLLFIVILIIFSGCLLFNGQIAGDAVNYWLPLSRELVRESAMPDLLLSNPTFITSRSPFLILLFAGTFSFSHFNEIFLLWLPILFSFLTLVLLYKWCKLKKIGGKYTGFILVLFLASPMVLSRGWNLIQAPLVLFFFVAFFYYFEKYKKEKTLLNFIILLFSFILAVVSKETGLLLIIPLIFVLFRRNVLNTRRKYLVIITALPMIVWWIRNYLIFDNPIFPILNNLFKGRYYEFPKAHLSYVYQYSLGNLFERFSLDNLSQFLIILPLIMVAFYVFFKEKRFEYLFLFGGIFLIGQFWSASTGEIRYYYPFLGILLIYFLSGLSTIKSRKFLSFLIFISLFGLFSTPVVLAKSSFISLIENQVRFLSALAEFIYNYKLILAFILALFFYFVLSRKQGVKYLILLVIGFYLIKTGSIQISWLNIWLPVLGLIIIILGWGLFSRLKENRLRRTVIIFIGLLLFLNTWGLNTGYYLTNNRFPYLCLEGFTILPAAGEKIKEIEDENKDFYVLTDHPRYLNWYYDYKEVDASLYTFNYITKLRYREDMNSKETHDLLQEANIKYIIKSTNKDYWDYFFKKIENKPELFKPILKQNSYTLWEVI